MRKKKIKDIVRTLDGVVCEMDRNTSLYIDNLEEMVFYLNIEKERLELELKEIKPVVEDKRLEPALSKYCGDCKYSVRTTWDNEVIGCRRSAVCDDFTPKEEDTK